LQDAGFHDVAIHVVPVARRLVSLSAAVDYFRNSNPDLNRLLSELPDIAREQAWTEIREALHQFDGPNGVVEPTEYLIGVGTK
jgi:hypothetical protein